MSLARDAVKAFALAHFAPLLGVMLSLAVVLTGAIWGFAHVVKQHWFNAGYAFAADSAREATILRLAAQHSRDIATADSLHANAEHLSAIVRDSAQPILSAARHTPRLEALTVPVTADTTLVGVFVQSTGEHFVLPRRAAMYWATSDSLVGVAQQLIKKYAAANAGWANAYTAEHEARVGADSLAALWRTRALANIAQPAAKSHRIVYLTLGIAAGFIAAKRIH